MAKSTDAKHSAEARKELLFSQKKHGVDRMKESELSKCDKFCEGYKKFLDQGKTEREACNYAVQLLKEHGFSEYEPGMRLEAGDRIYRVNRGKAVIAATIGTEPLERGLRLCAAHIDSPRLDLKQCPLYEDHELALFKTHYYGGIKKYQWTAIPLALHGVICRADGKTVEVCIGESESDPVFCVTDLLPHLAAEQMKRPLSNGIKGEELNLLIGSRPFRDEKASERVKLAILELLYEKYGITEDDFLSAELEAVPAFQAKDLGFDRSMIGAYGHDDRVCAYTALMAALKCKAPSYTSVTVLADKEEIGSDGNTGLCSAYLRYFVEDLADAFGTTARQVLSASQCLSADVSNAFDPTFSDVNERNNSAYLNHGVVMMKYTGARGKSGSSDASAEFVGTVRRLFDKKGILWQTGELGKVDAGGGGTVAAYIANLNVDTVDVGVPVLSMHAPYEIVSKIDTYMAYKAFSAFFSE